MNKILAVARWEYLEKVKSKAFLIGLLVTPVIMLAMGFLPMMFVTQEDTTTKVLGIIDRSGAVADQFRIRMESKYKLSNGNPNYVVRIIDSSPSDSASAVRSADGMVLSGELEGFCTVGTEIASDSVDLQYRSRSVGDFQLLDRMEKTLRGIIAEKRAQAMGLNPSVVKDLTEQFELRTVKLNKSGGQEEADFGKVYFSSFAFLMMMFFMIVTSGQLLVRSVIEEKSNRIVEVLVSSCSPRDLMAGKVLGLSGLGFTQLVIWGTIGLFISLKTGNVFIHPAEAGFLIMYFVLGYLFYAGVFIAAGSPFNTEQEAQQINSYLIILLILPIVLSFPAMRDPEATWLRVLTFIPFFTPTMMALRVPIQFPAPWEIAVTIVVMVASIYGAMVAAGKIFRIGILSTGKSPTLRELIHWVKNG
ncbi:MAG TPA: ABC transporter permease [Bacteroidota bacterium]|nr:ABC transporter permease [Bacteroidota bacterium]